VKFRKGISIASLLTALYHTAKAQLGEDDYQQYLETPMGGLYRVGLLFFGLIITATYTANLAAFLTNSNINYYGPLVRRVFFLFRSGSVLFYRDVYACILFSVLLFASLSILHYSTALESAVMFTASQYSAAFYIAAL
jgi:hypothetical protein